MQLRSTNVWLRILSFLQQSARTPFSVSPVTTILNQPGILLLHTRVRDGASKSKVERHFRTLKERCLYTLDMDSITSLAQFDTMLKDYMRSYNTTFHHGINGIPIDRYRASKDHPRKPESRALLIKFSMSFSRPWLMSWSYFKSRDICSWNKMRLAPTTNVPSDNWKTHTNYLLYILPPSDIFLLLPNSLFHLTINNASSEFRAIPIYCLLLEKFFVQKRCWHGDLFLSLIWSVSTVLSLHITFILSTTMLYIFGLNKLIANPFFLKNPFKLHIYIGC